MTWHIEQRLLADYAQGRTDVATASSVEQHVVGCGTCRSGLNDLVDDHLLVDVWDRILDAAQTPRPAPGERLLRRVGLTPGDALLLWAAPAFRAPWLAATLVTLAFATLAAVSSESRGLLLFVLVAPLLPLAGVALAYGPDADPAYEATGATPYSALRLILLRSLAVLATTVPVTLLAGALLPGHPAIAVAWLAPAIAAVALTLCLSTWLGVTRAAVIVGLGWAVGAIAVAGPGSTSPGLALHPSFIPVYVGLAAVSAVVLVLRGDHLAHLGGSS